MADSLFNRDNFLLELSNDFNKLLVLVGLRWKIWLRIHYLLILTVQFEVLLGLL